MAQSSQATPTMTANLGGTSTKVNLRDWLNTRMAPFLKQAIIDSLDAEPEFPLQWLGEQLILQSITFEGNPDTNNIREQFLYKHEIKNNGTQAQSTQPIAQSETPEQNVSAPEPASAPPPARDAQTSSDEIQVPPEAVPENEHQTDTVLEPPVVLPAVNGAEHAEVVTSTANHTSEPVTAEATDPLSNGIRNAEDTEMSNAP